MDEAAWAALTISLTVVGAIWTWFAFRNRGPASGVRAAGITLLPLAAYLTDTLRMFTRIVTAVGDWVTRLVLSPTVWVGLVLAATGVALIFLASAMSARGIGTRGRGRARSGEAESGRRGPEEPPTRSVEGGAPAANGPVVDDDMADIEAILRERGIS